MEILVQILTILASAGVLGSLGKYLEYKYKYYKKKKIAKNNSQSLSNDVLIYKTLIEVAQEHDFNYAHIFSLHNSGKVLTELSRKKLSIKWEYTGSKMHKPKSRAWDDRKASGEIKRFISFIDMDDILHCKDIEDTAAENRGIREIYNSKQGTELFFVKIGWYHNDTFLFAGFQRDKHENMQPLTLRQQAFIKYKCEEIEKLIEN